MIIAQSDGQIRIYHEKTLVNILQTEPHPTGMLFGTYGREEGCLVLNHKSGCISAKILQRQAKLNVSVAKSGPPHEQEIPLKIPQKTNLFVDLTQRERAHCVEMHT